MLDQSLDGPPALKAYRLGLPVKVKNYLEISSTSQDRMPYLLDFPTKFLQVSLLNFLRPNVSLAIVIESHK